MRKPFEIVSIRRVKAPPGAEGSRWHRYVIEFDGTSTIRGYRQGELKAVTGAVEEFLAQLNERHLKFSGKRGRVDLVWSPKKKREKS